VQGKIDQRTIEQMPVSTVYSVLANLDSVKHFYVNLLSSIEDTIDLLVSVSTSVARDLSTRQWRLPSSLIVAAQCGEGEGEPLEQFLKRMRKVTDPTMQLLFGKQLRMISGVSAEKSFAILQVYPTAALLMAAYKRCANVAAENALLESITWGVTKKKLGLALSRKIREFFRADRFILLNGGSAEAALAAAAGGGAGGAGPSAADDIPDMDPDGSGSDDDDELGGDDAGGYEQYVAALNAGAGSNPSGRAGGNLWNKVLAAAGSQAVSAPLPARTTAAGTGGLNAAPSSSRAGIQTSAEARVPSTAPARDPIASSASLSSAPPRAEFLPGLEQPLASAFRSSIALGAGRAVNSQARPMEVIELD